MQSPDILVIGGGPAGLMAAETAAKAGYSVVVAEAKPTVARKFLMAGKSGLNLTKDETLDVFINAYGEGRSDLIPMLTEFGPVETKAWANALGQEMFIGSSGRVFPKVMKASPLLRAWIGRLTDHGVSIRTQWRWVGWENGFQFDTPEGPISLSPKACVLACGGASWARLGSDGAWASLIDKNNLAPFAGSNQGFLAPWTEHMAPHFGAPLKNIGITAGNLSVRAECVLSKDGLEGGGIYAVSAALRQAQSLYLDLTPDLTEDDIRQKLSKQPRKQSLANRLRRALKLDPVKVAVLMECARPLPADIAPLIKHLHVPLTGPRPMDQAISTAGGLCFDAVGSDLMLNDHKGVFAAGEMLNWDAPTGGYLLTACLATGRWAGRSAAQYLSSLD